MNRRKFLSSLLKVCAALGVAAVAGLPEVDLLEAEEVKVIVPDKDLYKSNGQPLSTWNVAGATWSGGVTKEVYEVAFQESLYIGGQFTP